jgi:hypothetical protein
MQRRITARINSAFHFKLGFMIEIDGWNSAANGVDRSAVAIQIDRLAVAETNGHLAAANKIAWRAADDENLSSARARRR